MPAKPRTMSKLILHNVFFQLLVEQNEKQVGNQDLYPKADRVDICVGSCTWQFSHRFFIGDIITCNVIQWCPGVQFRIQVLKPKLPRGLFLHKSNCNFR